MAVAGTPWRAAVGVLWVVFGVQPAAAQTPAPLTLVEAFASALATHEQVRVAGAERSRAEVGTVRAYTLLGPNVRVFGGYTQRKDEIVFPFDSSGIPPGFNPLVLAGDVTQAMLTVDQPLYVHQFWALRDVGRAEARASSWGYDATRQDVLLATAVAYYELLRGQALLGLAKETAQLADTELSHARARLVVGEAVRADVVRAETSRARADYLIAEAVGSIESSVQTLRRMTGIAHEFVLAEPPPDPVDLGTVEPHVATAMNTNPDLKEAKEVLAAAQEETRRRRATLYPTLGLRWNYHLTDTETFAERSNFWDLTVGVTVPIFDAGGSDYVDLAEQEARVAGIRAGVDALRHDLELDVRTAFVAARTLASQITSTEKETRLAEETYRLLSEQYASGVATSLEVLSALTSREASYANRTTIQYSYAVALLRLKRATGTLGVPFSAEGAGS